MSGFASSSKISSGNQQERKIREKCPDINNRLKRLTNLDEQPDINEVSNLCVADRRAKFVERMLEGFVEKESQGIFEFQVKQWSGLEQMKDQTKVFYDVTRLSDEKSVCAGQNEGTYDQTRGLMNRRVDVSIIDTPLCMM